MKKAILSCALVAVFALSAISCSNDGSTTYDRDSIDTENPPDNSAFLSWDANTEPDLAGYKIHIDTQSDDYSETIDVGLTGDPGAPSYLLLDLDYDTVYYFTVSAYDSTGNESQHSTEVAKTIPIES